VSAFLDRAEEILETAELGSQEVAIAIDRRGVVRMIDPAGWLLPAMRIEFGAAVVYRVERRGGRISVEGWDGTRSCRLEKCRPRETRSPLAGLFSQRMLPSPA
jgi:hypothetical protein